MPSRPPVDPGHEADTPAPDQERSFVDAMPQIVWTARADGWVDYYNQRWLDYTGLTLQQSQGWGWEQVLHPEDRRRCIERWRHAIATGEPYEIEYRFKRASDGAYRWHLGRADPLRDREGHIAGWIGVCTDIDEQKQAEEALRASEEARAEAAARAGQLEATVEAMTDGVFVFDRTGRILETNGALRALLAIDSESTLTAFTMQERGTQLELRAADGEPLPADQWPVQRILRGEVIRDVDAVDVLVHAFDGRDVLMSVSGAPVYGPEGQLVAGVCVCRDVTERRRFERRTRDALAALLAMAEAVVLAGEHIDAAEGDPPRAHAQASEAGARLAELTRQFLGCTHVAIVAIDPQSELLHPVAIAGFSPEEAPGWWHQWDRQPRLQDRLADTHSARLRAGEVLLLDRTQPPFSSETAFGRRIVMMVPFGINDTFRGILSVDYGTMSHDATPDEIVLVRTAGRLIALALEHERLLQERSDARANVLALGEANRRMEEFLSIAGHELRTPLTSILGNVQLAERWVQTATPIAHDPTVPPVENLPTHFTRLHTLLQRLERQANLLNRLVGDVLDTARIQAGKLEMVLAPCDLAAIVRDVVQEQQQIALPRTIDLELPDQETVRVIADTDRIAQVLTNFLTNALKYSAAAQSITVGLALEEAAARVWVRDHGPGLSSAEQVHVWDRFYRTSGAMRQAGSSAGLGLGLYISRTIVERHRGEVGVESSPGAGATFWFRLPLADPERA